MKLAYLPYSTKETSTFDIYNKFLFNAGYKVQSISPKPPLDLDLLKDNVVIPAIIVTQENFKKRLTQISPNLFTPKVKKAIEIAKRVHKDQKRRSGVGYLKGHIFPVSIYITLLEELYENGMTEDLLITSILHDCIEDGKSREVIKELEKEFNKTVSLNVKTLTKPSRESIKKFYFPTKVNQSQLEKKRIKVYLQQLKKGGIDVLKVKCVDKILNLSSDMEIHDNRNKEQVKDYLNKTKNYYTDIFNNSPQSYLNAYLLTIDILESNDYMDDKN